MQKKALLCLDDVSVQFSTDRHDFFALSNISWSLDKGQCLCLVGESGCGKSMTALAIMGLLPQIASLSSGRVFFEGKELNDLSSKEYNSLRGQAMSMVFQEPMTSLNPLLTIETQIAEVLIFHEGLSKSQARERAFDILESVGISDAKSRLAAFPHQLSGGMRQRIMIGMALACAPQLLIADEPTTALDVSIQNHILHLLLKAKESADMGLLLITHNLGIVANMADMVGVMYAGFLVEYGPRADIFSNPLHPYTQGLLEAQPKLKSREARLPTIAGQVPPLYALPQGCAFQSRCSHVHEACKNPVPKSVKDKQIVLCHLYS